MGPKTLQSRDGIYMPTTVDGEFDAESILFTTNNPAPTPPEDIDVTINSITNKIDITWSSVECATGYKIHQKLGHSGTETEWTYDNSKDLAVSLESPEPCVTYRYIKGLDH